MHYMLSLQTSKLYLRKNMMPASFGLLLVWPHRGPARQTLEKKQRQYLKLWHFKYLDVLSRGDKNPVVWYWSIAAYCIREGLSPTI
ncbi:hypothetical protein FKM82_000323 [Ascaphus truei]